MSEPVLVVSVAAVQRQPHEFLGELEALLGQGARLLTWFGGPACVAAEVSLTAVLELAGALRVLRTEVEPARGFHSLSNGFPSVHIFERELHEEWGVAVHGHPWLKPVRFPKGLADGVATHPYYRLEGKGVHEVAVGPIHAGVIEPGHFRLQCLGEQVHHLEIQLGYQHRGVEALLVKQRPEHLSLVVETAAGDTSVAHAWASAAALEALRGGHVAPDTERVRGVGLELERVAMHLAGLAGLATDVAFLQGASTYGRLRTTAINTSMLLCGSRFGRGWLRAADRGLDRQQVDAVRDNLSRLKADLAIINHRFLTSYTVQQRLKGVGVVTKASAAEIGLVGLAARASGLSLDTRVGFPGALYTRLPVSAVAGGLSRKRGGGQASALQAVEAPPREASGDCWARGAQRIRELDESLGWLERALEEGTAAPAPAASGESLAPNQLAVSLREGWRGEVVHAVETDEKGALRRYRLQDPSLRNWFGLALAVRENEISDFPICNKSFDLSYCGHDL